MDFAMVASGWTGTLTSTVLMLLGFGLVILIHELGHFLVAKRVGIRVDEFAIGFGKRLWSIRRGETEYRINVLPLGGYVKMPGQEDFALKDSEATDPRAYNNKPIWARLCVVSAGVVMNVILAAVLFFIVFAVGKDYAPAMVGSVTPGYPAARAELPGDLGTGLQPGDRIERINGKEVWKFDTLLVKAILADPTETFTFTIRRPGVPDPFDVRLGVAPSVAGGQRTRIFGIGQAIDRVLNDHEDAQAMLTQMAGDALQGGDIVVAFDDEPIEHGWQIKRAEARLTGEPVPITVERLDPKTGTASRHAVTLTPELTWSDHLIGRINRRALEQEQDLPFDIPTFNILGLVPRMRVAFVQPGSPADKAGIRPGDVIAGYGPAADVPTVERLRRISHEYRGATVPIRILRDGAITSDVTAVAVPNRERPTIGIESAFDRDHLVVAGVQADSPWDGVIPRGATLRAVNATPIDTWRDLIDAAAALDNDGQTVALTYETPAGAEKRTEAVALDRFDFHAADYGYRLALPYNPLTHLQKETNPWSAVVLGVRETGDFIVLTYATLHGFFAGRVPGSGFTGPVGIFRAGIAVGERGAIWIVWLLAIISANLAVINFLPLPIVDGGLAVMLLVEKIRGKPLNVQIQNAIQVAGLVLIAVLFVLLTYNDIVQWMRSG